MTIRDRAHELADRANARVDAATSTAGHGLQSSADGVRRAGNATADTLQTAGNYLESHDARAIGADMTQVIRNHPKIAVAVGLGIGFLIGRMLAR